MPTYMPMPRSKITLGATEFESTLNTAVITRLENGFDTATIELPDTNSALYPGTVTNGTAVQIDVRTVGGAYTTIFKGVVRFPIFPEGTSELIQLKCDGAGYGLADTVVMNEYGSQSVNPTLDTITEIIGDATDGIMDNYVEKILKGSASGFTYTVSFESALAGDEIPYVYFTYKPCNKAIDDLIDIVAAKRAGAAGLHWIVTTADYFLLKSIDQTLGGWTKYYGNSQANSTLTPADFTTFPKFEPMGPEANYIIYNGLWRRPSNGDWTENNSASWATGSATYTDETTIKTMGGYSVKGYFAAATGVGFAFTFPASIDISTFTRYNIPSLNFDLAVDRVMTPLSGAGIYNNFFIRFFSTSGANYDYILPGDGSISKGTTAGDQNFQHFSIQLGPYSKDQWQHSANSLDWADIESIEIWCPNVQSAYLDGFNIGGSQVVRHAKNSTNITANKAKMRVITDSTPKDDSLTASDDSGLMAQLAYSELLRLQKSSIVGSVTTPMIADALPGQLFHIHAKETSTPGTYTIDKDFRASKIIHVISPSGFFTSLELTDDLINSHARAAYEDRNKLDAARRPEYQDRQAASIKSGNMDIWVTPLVKDYPS